jgi:hypothetical protein
MGLKKSDVFLAHLYSQKTPENGYKNQTFAKIKKQPRDNRRPHILKIFDLF